VVGLRGIDLRGEDGLPKYSRLVAVWIDLHGKTEMGGWLGCGRRLFTVRLD
jgi:hypothetical protein